MEKAFFLNFNYFYVNFFLFKSFDSIFFFILYKKENLNYFYKHKNINNIFLNSFKHNDFNLKSNFFLRFYKIINSKLIIKNNYINIDFANSKTFNYSNFVILDSIFFNHIKFFNIFILNLFNKNRNLLILDSNYKNNYFLYSNMFNTKDLLNYNSFFFPKPDYFCKKSWVLFFSYFCKFHKISIFFVNDFFKFNKYFNEIALLNIPFASFVPAYVFNDIIDYPIYFTSMNLKLIQFISTFIINNVFFINLNYKFINYRFWYFKNIFYFFNLLK